MQQALGRSYVLASFVCILWCVCSVGAQTNCNDSIGPDLILGDITAPTNYASENGIDAFSAGSVYCNIGDAPVIASTQPSPNHPLTGQNLYRLKTVNGVTRVEQIGMMWLHDVFCPLSQSLCCTACQPPPNCSQLGVRCSSPDSSGINGTQSFLRPRWQVNAATGAFPGIGANPSWSGAVARRLQARHSDLDPAQSGGGQYYIEMFILAADDAAVENADNNYSHRSCNIIGGPSEFSMSLSGSTQRGKPAISAWKASDAGVTETVVDVPNDGRFIIAAKATNMGSGIWHYEYAVQNLNSDLSARAFVVPQPEGAVVSNIGFHDVDYHSNDGVGNSTIDGTDWVAKVTAGGDEGPGQITWSTDDFKTNPNANALRFATLYNFRFDCNATPTNGTATLGMFKAAGTAEGITVIPGALSCAGDIAPANQGDGTVNVNDLLAIINNWGPCEQPCAPYCAADITHDCTVSVNDLLAVINTWGACP